MEEVVLNGHRADTLDVVHLGNKPIESNFYPQKNGISQEYVAFMGDRENILDCIRKSNEEENSLFEDIVDTLIECDLNVTIDPIALILNKTIFFFKIRNEREKQKEVYRRVVNSILEKIFDPMLEFKMTKKDILDVFEAKGIDRNKVTNAQISKIYVKVLDKLTVGELRDITLKKNLHQYIHMKINEITISREVWELNGR